MWIVQTTEFAQGKIIYTKYEFEDESEAKQFFSVSPGPRQIYKIDFI